MDEEYELGQELEPDGWNTRAEKLVALAGTVSKVLFVGAGLALLLGIVDAVATFSSLSATAAFDGGASTALDRNSIAVAQTASQLIQSLLPAGLLAASAVAIRIQAYRFEAERLQD